MKPVHILHDNYAPTSMPLTINVIETRDQLLSLREEWNQLSRENPFLSWDWAETWWRHYECPSVRLFVLAVRDEQDQLVGLAPWKIRQTLSRGRVVRFIGSNEVCGDRLTIVATPERQLHVYQAIAQWLSTASRDQWDLIELQGVEQSNRQIAEFATMLADLGHQTHIREDLNCWKIELPDDWEKYLASISKSRRNRTRRLLKREIGTGRATQQSVNSPADFERGYGVLIDLHQKRRVMLGDPGCFASERYLNFHREFAQRMLAQNRLRLAWTEIEGRPAAVEYDFLGEQTIYNYQSGFEPELFDEQPGWLNLACTLKWATEHGFHTFDMLRGDESYKASFGAKPAPLMQVRVVGHHASARLRHAAWRTQATVKRWARTSLDRAAQWRNAKSATAAVNATTDAAEQDAE